MSGKLEFKKLRAFGEIINDTFLFIKENFRPLLKVFIYLCGFFLLGATITSVMQQLDMKTVMNNSGTPSGVSKMEALLTFNYFVLILFSLASYAAITVSVLSFIALYIQNDKVAPGPEQVWAYFKYYFFRVFFSSFFVGVLVVLAFILCLVPGIYIFPAMSLFFPVMVLENADFQYSFSRSFKLLKEQWWVTAGAIFIIWVITYACMMFASVPAIALTMVGTFIPAAKEWSTVMIIIGTVIQTLTYVFAVIPVIGVALCYFNLVEVHESTGLMDRINQFGEGKDHPADSGEY